MIEGLVSVIIPTYNRADYVVEAVRSAQAQTYPRKQIIVVDDGSRDDTARRVSELGGVEYRYQPRRGQGAARNHGLRVAAGEFIASLDSDDLWDADFLSRSVECLEEFRLDFVFTNWLKVRDGRTLSSEWLSGGKWRPYRTDGRGEWWLLAPPQVRRLFLERCPAPSSSLLLRRDSIASGWGAHMQIADDWYLLLDMALRRPCRAAFTLRPRWRKRVDGMNVYDGRPFAESVRRLYLNDHRNFRREFRARLRRRERLALWRSETTRRLHLFLHESADADPAGRLIASPVLAGLRRLRGAIDRHSERGFS